MYKPKVLFVCTGNSCRSQIAEGLLRNKAGDKFDIFSAGTYPSHVHPAAMKVMEEWGIDISHHTSDPIDLYLEKGIDIVITVCDHANKICPTFPGNVERLHWSIEDPFVNWNADSTQLETFRETREIIRKRIVEFLMSRKNG